MSTNTLRTAEKAWISFAEAVTSAGGKLTMADRLIFYAGYSCGIEDVFAMIANHKKDSAAVIQWFKNQRVETERFIVKNSSTPRDERN